MRGLAAEPVLLVLVIGAIVTMMISRNRFAGTTIVGSAFLIFYALSTPVVSTQLLAAAELPHSTCSEQHRSLEEHGAIVVLSAGHYSAAPGYGRYTVDGLSLERPRYAAHVARKTDLPALVSGGCIRDDEAPLASLMK